MLRLQDLQTSNGPLLKVWITDAPVLPGTDGWSVFDDGSYVDLGELKGNIGSSNYPLPADVDLSRLTSVSVWCDRFNVSFGAAQLAPGQPERPQHPDLAAALHHRAHTDDAQPGDSGQQPHPDERLQHVVQEHAESQNPPHILADL